MIEDNEPGRTAGECKGKRYNKIQTRQRLCLLSYAVDLVCYIKLETLQTIILLK